VPFDYTCWCYCYITYTCPWHLFRIVLFLVVHLFTYTRRGLRCIAPLHARLPTLLPVCCWLLFTAACCGASHTTPTPHYMIPLTHFPTLHGLPGLVHTRRHTATFTPLPRSVVTRATHTRLHIVVTCTLCARFADLRCVVLIYVRLLHSDSVTLYRLLFYFLVLPRHWCYMCLLVRCGGCLVPNMVLVGAFWLFTMPTLFWFCLVAICLTFNYYSVNCCITVHLLLPSGKLMPCSALLPCCYPLHCYIIHTLLLSWWSLNLNCVPCSLLHRCCVYPLPFCWCACWRYDLLRPVDLLPATLLPLPATTLSYFLGSGGPTHITLLRYAWRTVRRLHLPIPVYCYRHHATVPLYVAVFVTLQFRCRTCIPFIYAFADSVIYAIHLPVTYTLPCYTVLFLYCYDLLRFTVIWWCEHYILLFCDLIYDFYVLHSGTDLDYILHTFGFICCVFVTVLTPFAFIIYHCWIVVVPDLCLHYFHL